MSSERERFWEEILMPEIEDFVHRSTDGDDLALIKKWKTDGRSLPAAIFSLIVKEGRFIEGQCRGKAPHDHRVAEAEIAYWYGWAPGWIILAEKTIRGENVTEGVIRASLKEVRAKLREEGREMNTEELHAIVASSPSGVTFSTVTAANFHIAMASLTPLLKKDPSGFSLIDHVLSSPDFVKDYTEDVPYPALIQRLVYLGAERYKKYYRTAGESDRTI